MSNKIDARIKKLIEENNKANDVGFKKESYKLYIYNYTGGGSWREVFRAPNGKSTEILSVTVRNDSGGDSSALLGINSYIRLNYIKSAFFPDRDTIIMTRPGGEWQRYMNNDSYDFRIYNKPTPTPIYLNARDTLTVAGGSNNLLFFVSVKFTDLKRKFNR